MKTMIHKTYLFVLSLILSAVYVSASEADSVSRKVIHMIGTDFRPSYVFPTHEFFRGANSTGERIDATLSGHLKYGFRFSPSTKMGRMYPYAVQGIGIAYNTFFCPSEVGNPLAVYVFQTSRIAALTPKLSLDYEWNFGASFGWKKYDEETNPWNRVVGSKINAYINLGFMLNWQLAPNTNLRAGIDVTHYSNGNTHYPNSGVNTIGTSVGVTHFFGNGVPERILSSGLQRENTFHRYVSYDLIVYGATRKRGIFPADSNPVLAPGAFGILGLNFNPLYNFSKYFRAGVSLDMQYDESANIGNHVANDNFPSDPDELQFYRPPFREQFSAGLSLRAEIVIVLTKAPFESNKTKDFAKALEAINGGEKKTLIVLGDLDANLILAARNLHNVKLTDASDMSVYDIVDAQSLIILENALIAPEAEGAEKESE